MSKQNEWFRIRQQLKKKFERMGVMACEVKLNGCKGQYWLTWAHRHKRVWYYDKPGMLEDYLQVCLACISCHMKMEQNRQLTESVFMRIRGSQKPIDRINNICNDNNGGNDDALREDGFFG